MDIRDNTARNRYEMDLDGGTAYIDYRKSPGVVTLVYAMVPPALRGRGHGARMTRAVLELIRAQGDKVVPHCGFVATYMRRHPEYADLLLKP
jgi:predicted GNAT family acetyltransferase